jgi:uncharacterized protein YjaG (DUF416 family)
MDDLLADIRLLDHVRRIAFAAICAERLIPNYEEFQIETGWGDADVLRQALALAWDFMTEPDRTGEKYRAVILQCKAVAPDADDFMSPLTSLALDAAAATAATLELCLKDSAERAAFVAQSAYDSAFAIAQMRGVHDPTRARRSERHELDRAAQSDLVVAEAAFQRALVARLKDVPAGSVTELRAIREGFLKAGVPRIRSPGSD